MSWSNQAISKLRKELEQVKGGAAINVMKRPVCDAVIAFCQQNEEFAQAVVQGGTFDLCMKHVAKGVGSALSDFDAYRRAASFYFEGAQVKAELHIQLEPVEYDTSNDIVLNLTDFF